MKLRRRAKSRNAMKVFFSKLAGNLESAGRNRHVSVPALLALLCEVGRIWWPAQAEQFSATQKVFLGYAVLAAGNAGPKSKP